MPATSRPRHAAAALVAAGLAATAAPAIGCTVAPLVSPAPGASIAHARPLLGWSRVAGIDTWRVQVLSRVTEGAVVERIDTLVTGTAFEPPRALADRHATVQVLVTDAACPDADVGAAPAAFFVDPALACPAPSSLGAQRAGTTLRLAWSAVEAATVYEITVFAPDGRTVSRASAAAPRATLDAPAGGVIAVRALCRGGPGRPVWTMP